MKRTRLALASLLALSCLLGARPAAAEGSSTLKIGYAIARESHFGAGIDTFARELDRLTRGRIQVEHLPGGKAGGELELITKVRNNLIDMAIISSGPVSAVVPEVALLDLPFLFYSYGHAHRTLDGPIGKDLLARFQQHGIVALAWAEHGFRHVTNNRKPIVYIDDLRDMRIRTMENPVHMATMRALKATPTPMPFPKLRDALETGEVDGQENPVSVILSSKLYERQRYMSLTYHFYSAGVIMIAPKTWVGLSTEDRAAVQQAAIAAAATTRRRVALDEITALEQLKNSGIQVNVFVDGAGFRRLLRQQYPQFFPGVDRELLRAIQDGS